MISNRCLCGAPITDAPKETEDMDIYTCGVCGSVLGVAREVEQG